MIKKLHKQHVYKQGWLGHYPAINSPISASKYRSPSAPPSGYLSLDSAKESNTFQISNHFSQFFFFHPINPQLCIPSAAAIAESTAIIILYTKLAFSCFSIDFKLRSI
jgi:hypothetical protein